MADRGVGGITRIIQAGVYSWQGLCSAWQHEAAFRQEVGLALVLVPLGLYLGEGGVEKALLVSSVLLLPLVELVNSAVESVVDRFGGELHELSGRAKDQGSAAVAVSMLIMVTVWGLVLFVD